jgi:hypothetical protein
MNMNNLDLDKLLDDADNAETISFEPINRDVLKKWENGTTIFRFVPFPTNMNLADKNSQLKMTSSVKLNLHYAKDSEGKIIETFICPKSYGKGCDSCEHGWEVYNGLKKQNKTKELEDQWKKFLPSESYVYYGFDRSREEEFIKQGWFELEPVKFSKTTHEAMEALAKDPEVGKYQNYFSGFDIKVTYNAEAAKNRNNSTSVKEVKSRSPLLSLRNLSSTSMKDDGFPNVSAQDEALIKQMISESYKRMVSVTDIYALLDSNQILDILEKMSSNNRLATEVVFDNKSKLMKAAQDAGVMFDDADVPF